MKFIKLINVERFISRVNEKLQKTRLFHDTTRMAQTIFLVMSLILYEPRYEKTGLRGFHTGLTQTGLYSHRRWLEA